MKVAGLIPDNLSSNTMVLGSTQPLTQMSTRNLAGGKGRPAHKADNLTAMCADCLENMGTSTSQNPMGLCCLLEG
jgi:hypothetical protein